MADAGKLPLPAMPYEYNALEPHIDEAIMRVHHLGHHQGYTNKLNAALEKLRAADAELGAKGIDEILQNIEKAPEALRGALRNNGGGYVNHRLFWNIMGPAAGGAPSGALAEAITAQFGSFDDFKAKFTSAAATLFGSGWAWLYLDTTKSPAELVIGTTANQDTPAMTAGHVPILGLDVWEHAYYLQYQNKRGDYIAAWWNVVNWTEANRTFEEARA